MVVITRAGEICYLGVPERLRAILAASHAKDIFVRRLAHLFLKRSFTSFARQYVASSASASWCFVQ
jgi:hypothetical protein